ncbi:FAD-dependent oxidoreductase [Sideroxydans lithotrophicus]|uniref:FAD-dependent pyridine nucleotide-disulfide oxidoreductase n=1 Tax=Sideroxydans lithotrophicus (strain ES-1) TaxID=580332 RepID=D5CT16_SIDLE|nr:FAD-dependent oxidoreductase [Sideroxydans lithotrophicus]ADE12102.1 FAD-dependent pyridine nucleotide-disulfide oxidoreductase [Sideroxydans lithotrophicus ES-1]
MRIAIIGSGPAGFYAAEALLRRTDEVIHVDMFDRLPTPFGLVRGGVAPDHQNIKAVTRVYEKTAARPTFRFFGNVCLGVDLTVDELRQHYHQIVYAIGNEADRRLGIPGEGIARCTPASVFIGWYNGHPDYRHAKFDLSVSRVAVVGNGNVAIDAARILLRTPAELEKTDIAAHALEVLRNSQVREVFMLGRRGPEQASFTSAELRELGEMEDAEPIVAPGELAACAVPESADISQKDKNLKILQAFAARQPGTKAKKLHMRFLVSPTEVIADAAGNVSGLKLEKNRLETRADGTITARGTGEIEILDAGMVLPAIGYSVERIAGVPYDEKTHVIANEDGRVVDPVTRAVISNEYVVGWARTGPQGLIGTHKAASAHVAKHMLIDSAGLSARTLPDREAIVSLLRKRGLQIVTFSDWKQIDEIEIARGERRNAPRDKIVDLETMLAILGQH